MKYSLRYHWQTETQLYDIVSWYELQQKYLGYFFLESFEEAIKQIQTFPEGVEIKRKKYRVAKIRKFPYVIVFELAGGVINIISVTHTSRKPSIKFKK
jgi:hypothetical protein